MKQIKIKQLDITNFKGQTIHSTFDGENCVISGFNKSGKTTHIKAWQWLLTGYTDTLNPKNFELFDNTKELSNDTPLASIKAVILIDDVEYKLERTAVASFSRKKGEIEYTKDSSDKYSTSIDDIEYSATNFKEWIEANICPIDMLPYLVNGEFFANLTIDDKDKARKVLENIIGEIKQSDFKADYGVLFKMLERFTIEDLKTQTKERMRPIKADIESLPLVIDNKQKDIAELSNIDFDKLEKDIEAKNKEIADIDNELLGSSEKIKPIIEKRNNELAEIDTFKRNLSNAKTEYENKAKELPNKIRKEIDAIDVENELIKKRNAQAEKDFKDKQNRLVSLTTELDSYNTKRTTLLKKRDDVKARIFSADKCAYCGQELPIEKREELQTKFNEEKQRDLDNIITDGKSVKASIDDIQTKINSLNEELKNGLIQANYINTDDKEKEYENSLNSIIPFEATKEYEDLSVKILNAERKVTDIPQTDNSGLTEKKKALQEELGLLNQELGKKSELERHTNQLNELFEKQRNCGIELAKLQKLEQQINEYVEEKANIISSRVNDLLDICYIEMQSVQKNGDKKPDCIVCRKDKVKYATINGSDRLLMCVDLQRMFCKYYKIMLPLFLDEVSVIDEDRLPVYDDMQCIYIKRSDNKLKVEKI